MLWLFACKSPVIAVDYLAVTFVSPPPAAADIDVDSDLTATFSEPLVLDSVAPSTVYVEDIEGVPLAIDVVYGEDDNSLTVTPLEPLLYDATYTFVLSSSLQGEYSGRMPTDVASRFRTGLPGGGPDNLTPVANAGVDSEGEVLVDMRLDGTTSYDPEGQPLHYTWRTVGKPVGSSTFVEVPDASNPVVRPDIAGNYLFGLIVSDGYTVSEEDFVQVIVPP